MGKCRTTMQTVNWPDDADGDVLRRLESEGFDFSRSYEVDFNIDFLQWPPPQRAIDAIKNVFPALSLHEDEDGGGYILIKVNSVLSYKWVVETQAMASALVADAGGKCDSWGILH